MKSTDRQVPGAPDATPLEPAGVTRVRARGGAGVHQGDVDAFRRLVAEGTQRVADEPGTLGYAWFESTDATEFVAHESFADSGAVLAHAANVGDLVEQWVDLADRVDVEIFGAPSEELHSAL